MSKEFLTGAQISAAVLVVVTSARVVSAAPFDHPWDPHPHDWRMIKSISNNSRGGFITGLQGRYSRLGHRSHWLAGERERRPAKT